MYLGPYFSYPIYDPIKILFSKPFDRLYEDIYILNDKDVKMMAERIYLVYKNFAELLSLYLWFDHRYDIQLKKSLREYIFLWNCASTYFDNFYLFYGQNILENPGCYYITSNSGFIQVIDLIENKNIISSESATYLKTKVEYPPLYTSEESTNWGGLKYDPFEVLLPCEEFFKRFGFDTEVIPIETILPQIEQLLRIRAERRREFYRK